MSGYEDSEICLHEGRPVGLGWKVGFKSREGDG